MKQTNYSLYKSNGKMKGERIRVRAFKDSEAMNGFLCSQYDNSWKVNSGVLVGAELPHKPGTYAFAGGRWHNVKSLDPSILAHI